MKLIWKIFVRDVRQATRNVIAVIVAMGLVIVPALYAWYNIAASWDPYGNTKALKVAVANVDKGYKSGLMPITINVGETVTSTLRANHDLDWQFVDRAKAIDGVNSGEYYAALIIPKSFSSDMMTLFSPKIKHAKLEYYLNEKINPIAPHITDQGATTVATTIDQTFVKTLASVALDLVSNVADYAQSPQMEQYVNNASSHIATMSSRLTGTASQMDSYANLLGAANSIIDSTDKLLGSTGSAAATTKKALKQTRNGVSSLDKALSGATDGVGTALQQAGSSYDTIAKQIDAAFADVGSQSSQISNKLTDMQSKVEAQADSFGKYAAALRDLAKQAASLPVGGDTVAAQLNAAADQATKAQQSMQQAATALGDAATHIANGTADADTARRDLKSQIAAAKQSITQASDTYKSTLKPQLNNLTSSMDEVTTQASSVIDGLASTVSSVSGLSGGVSDSIASMLAAPVAVDRIALYPVANYGSAMAPFYTILSIWVGAIILVAMLKVSISDHEKARILGLGNDLPLGSEVGLREAMIAGRIAGPAAALDVLKKPRAEAPGNARQFGLRLHHEYFGRYMIFGFLALLQGTLVCLGDMFYLGVQCEHPIQFLMVGWLSALVFSNIVYTLTLSFGDIGKAIAVVLLVMQVAGSGGTFPIETLPTFFQVVSKWLLFPYAVDAMHSAMAGSFGMEYWVSMGKLALFLVPSLLLGLMLRKPVIRFNDWVIRNLENTKVM